MAEHYKPQHPLPEELQILSRDDTVCQFCGVSYLIHNEIKRLEEKLQEYANEVERLKGFDEREKQLNIEVSLLKDKSIELLQRWEEEENRYKKICKDVEDKELFITEQRLKLTEQKKSIDILTETNNKLKNHKRNLQKKFAQLQSVVVKTKNDVNLLKDLVTKTNQQYIEENKTLKNNLHAKIKTSTKYWYDVIEKQNTKHELIVKEMNGKFKHDKDEFLQSHKIENMKLIQKHEKYLTDYKEKEKQLVDEHQEVVKEYELEHEHLSKKLQNLNIDHSKVLKNSTTEKEKFIEEIKTLKFNLKILTENGSHDKQSLVNGIQTLKDETIYLKEERQKMIDAHQHRIEDLRESFLQKLKEADKWPGKLEEELNKQQKRFEEEKAKLLNEVSEPYKAEAKEKDEMYEEKLSNEKQKYRQFEKKAKQQLNNLQINCEDKMKIMQQNIENITKDKENLLTSSNKKIDELQQQLENHVFQIAELEKLLEKHNDMLHHQKNVNQYKQRLNEFENLLQYGKEDMMQKNKIIVEHEDELRSLRECVRRECEERYELTEALAIARTELLTLQRYYGNNSLSKHRTVVPSPPAHGRKHSPNNVTSEEDIIIRRKISQNKSNSSLSSITASECSTSVDGIKNKRMESSGDKSRERINIAMGRLTKNKLKLSLKSSYSSN